MRTSHTLLQKIQNDLKKEIDHDYLKDSAKYFKFGTHKSLGVRTPVVRKIAKAHFSSIKQVPKKSLFEISENMLNQGIIEYKTIVFEWLHRRRKEFRPNDFALFSRWVKTYLADWDDCDDFCTHAFGAYVCEYPQHLEKVATWTKSKNWVVRRVAAVSLIWSVRRGQNLDSALKISQALFADNHDLVQKGYGWLLKEASKRFPQETLAFIEANKHNMSRTSLRHSIEKYPDSVRKGVLKSS